MTATITEPIGQISDDELVELLNANLHDDDLVDAVLAELERREEPQEELVDEAAQLRAMLEQDRRPGESLDQLVDRLYGDATYARYVEAENATRGHMLNRAGLAAEVDPYSLFHGPARRAAKYASRELLDWWQENGRVTWIEYKARMLGRPSDIRAAAAAKRRAADFGL